jgi:hypothetical protein
VAYENAQTAPGVSTQWHPSNLEKIGKKLDEFRYNLESIFLDGI